MTRGRTPPAPADLSEASRSDWPGLASDVSATLGGAETDWILLADVLRARDRLAQVAEVLNAEGVTVEGSKGQTRPHPLLNVEGELRRDIANGLEQLKLGPRERWRAVVDGNGRLHRSD